MRRFSQRNQLVTLNEINITPLLDLAFVLLIIFIITTPLLEQSVKLDLPESSAQQSKPKQQELRTVEITPDGFYALKGRKMNARELEPVLAQEFEGNPKLALYIRADRREAWEKIITLLDICQRHNIKRLGFGTKEPRR
jgi:biopolymer transport protein ExbD